MAELTERESVIFKIKKRWHVVKETGWDKMRQLNKFDKLKEPSASYPNGCVNFCDRGQLQK